MPRSILFGTLLLLALPASMRAEPRLAAHSVRSPELQVLVDAGSWTVVRGATRAELPLPPRSEVETIMPFGAGWLLAGTRANAADGVDLLLLRGGDRPAETIAAPPRQLGGSALLPSLVTREDGSLAGLSWLEGNPPGRFAIRWAPWTGEGLGAAETVAPAGPGSQTALTGAVLDDGRVLLVWAGFDGEDDEIWASLSSAQGWSAPQRVAPDNQVPDITPAVRTTPRGALVVWSRFDGSEYRLAAARFDGSAFTDVRFIGPPGSLFPTFEGSGSTPTLLFRDARQGAWAAAQLSPRGEIVRTVRLPGRGDERPAIESDAGGVVWSLGPRSVTTSWQ